MPTAKPAPTVSPLGLHRYKLQLTASQQLHDKLRQAQDLLRHDLPDGDVAQVLERALDLLVAQRMKRHFGQSAKPRAKRAAAPLEPGSRHVPNNVRRAALARAGARCCYVSADGKRCDQRGWLELHHEDPFARGGAATPGNIHVFCRAHNQLAAERDYGADFMRQRIEQARRERSTRSERSGPA